MELEWRPVVGYEGLYEVSSEGTVKSLDRFCNARSGVAKQFIRGRVLTPIVNAQGYCRLNLCNEHGRKAVFLHRIVAEAFLPKPFWATQINHIDENKLNNSVDNLEWCDAKYNCNYGSHKQKLSAARTGKGGKPVVAINKITGEEKYYPTLHSVKKDGHDVRAVYNAIYHKPHKHGGVRRSHHGFIWRYANGDDFEKADACKSA